MKKSILTVTVEASFNVMAEMMVCDIASTIQTAMASRFNGSCVMYVVHSKQFGSWISITSTTYHPIKVLTQKLFIHNERDGAHLRTAASNDSVVIFETQVKTT